MNIRQIAFAVSLALLSALLAHADCDHPGTPNPVKAYPLSNTSIELDITNTAREGSSHDIWFLIQDKQNVVTRFTVGHINYGQTTPYIFTKLTPNQQYCYEVWTRDDSPQGCRSEQPSGWVCATTAPPFPSGGGGISGGHPPPIISVGGSPPSGGGTKPPGGGTPPPPTSTVGGKCVADYQTGAHCLETGPAPSVCNYGTCLACIPHLSACKPGASQTCCQIADGDGCVIDPRKGNAVCDLVDGSLPGKPKRPVKQMTLDLSDWHPTQIAAAQP